MKGFNLSEWAINHRPFVWFLMILFVAAGVLSYKQLGREEDPSFSIKTRAPAAPNARVSKRERSPARLVPHIIGKALGLGWLTDRCSIGDAARNLYMDL